MKANFNSKRTLEVRTKIEQKNKELEETLKSIISLINNKASITLIEQMISKRNCLDLDIRNLEKQEENLKYKRNQYGEEVKERNVRNWID